MSNKPFEKQTEKFRYYPGGMRVEEIARPKSRLVLVIWGILALILFTGLLVFQGISEWQAMESELAPHREAKAIIQEANRAIKQGNYQSAFDLASKAIDLEPDNSLGYEARSVAAYEMGRYAEAVADLTKMMALEPDRIEVLIWRGHTYYEWKRYQLALDDYNAAIKCDPEDEDATYYRMMTALQMEDDDKVMEYAAEALRINPRNADAEAFMGMVYIYSDDLDSALAHFNRAIQYDIGLAEAYYLRAQIFYEKGDWINTRSDLQTFMSIDSHDPKAAEIRVMLDWLDAKIAGKDLPMPEFPDRDF